MDFDQIMKKRFNATPMPQLTGNGGKDKELIVQWLLEILFFRDFIYRNPSGKTKGKEFSDALIIYNDTIIIVQVKAHESKKNIHDWIKKELPSALKQLKGSYRFLTNGIVKDFENEILGTKIHIDLNKHKSIYGIVILSHESPEYDPLYYINKNDIPNFLFNIFSLNDFKLVCQRFDTAGDFIPYLEMRYDAAAALKPKIQDEDNYMRKIIPLLPKIVPKLFGDSFQKLAPEKQDKTLETLVIRLSRNSTDHPDYQYSLLIDDIIARTHSIDSKLYPINRKTELYSHQIAEILGYLTRERRIVIGKKMYNYAEKARDGKDHYFARCQRPIGQTYVFLFTSRNRRERSKYLSMLARAAQVKYGFPNVLGITTEPIGPGRSYDFILLYQMPNPLMLKLMKRKGLDRLFSDVNE